MPESFEATRFRALADKARLSSAGAKDSEIKATYDSIADQYEKLANGLAVQRARELGQR